MLVTSAAVGAAVAVSGIVGFVGIIVPHLVRLLAGPDHRVVLPASALMGATLVLVADIFARMLLRPAELPLGVVMAIIGAPVFLHMVVKRGMAGEAERMLQARDVTYTRRRPHAGRRRRRGRAARPRRGADRSQRRRQVDAAAHPGRRAAPTRGSVLLDGRDLRSFSAAELARQRARRAAGERAGLSLHGAGGGHAGRQRAGLRRCAPRTPRRQRWTPSTPWACAAWPSRLYVHLSGGERQRVHIARALSQLAAAPRQAGETRCLLLDEPTSSLDLAHQSLVLAAIRRQARAGAAVAAVFHDLNLAAALADELVLLEGGRVMAAGPPADVLSDDLLSAAYGCRVLTNRTPGEAGPSYCRRPSSPASAPPEPRRHGSSHRQISGPESTKQHIRI